MTPEQRREYIAEKILGWIKQLTSGVGQIPVFVFYLKTGEFILPEFLPDFESLPEWTGPICEVVLPMLAREGIDICFFNPQENEFKFYFDDQTTDTMISLDRYSREYYTHEFITALVDAHIKITGEKGE